MEKKPKKSGQENSSNVSNFKKRFSSRITPKQLNRCKQILINMYTYMEEKSGDEFAKTMQISRSDFSYARTCANNALGDYIIKRNLNRETVKKGAPRFYSFQTENTSVPNPFFPIYNKCIDFVTPLRFLKTMFIMNILNSNSDLLMKKALEKPSFSENSIVSGKELYGKEGSWYTAINIATRIPQLLFSTTKLSDSERKQNYQTLDRLTSIGYVKRDSGDQTYYQLNGFGIDTIKCLVPHPKEDSKYAGFFERFVTMIDFFSEIFPLGEIGNRLSSQINQFDYYPFRYKHRFIENTLNDYLLIDILHAIHNQYWLKVCFRTEQHTQHVQHIEEYYVLPLQIRINCTNGRENVIYYNQNEKAIKSVCLDDIAEVKLYDTNLTEQQIQDLQKLKIFAFSYINSCWETDFDDFVGGNFNNENNLPLSKITISFKFVDSTFYYISDKILFRLKSLNYTDISSKKASSEGYVLVEKTYRDKNQKEKRKRILASCTVTVSSCSEFTSWLYQYLPFIEKIQLIKPNNTESDYSSDTCIFNSLSSNVYHPLENPPSEILFCEENGFLHTELWKILVETIESLNEQAPQKTKDSFFCDIDGEIDDIFECCHPSEERKQGDNFNKYVSPIKEWFHQIISDYYPDPGKSITSRDIPYLELPLSNIERDWLISVFNDSISDLFLSSEEKRRVLEYIKKPFSRVSLFSLNEDIVLCGISDNNIEYDQNTQRIFRSVLSGIIHNQLFKIEYENNKNTDSGNNSNYAFFESISFSKRERTFLVNTVFTDEINVSKRCRILRLDKISKCILMSSVTPTRKAIKEYKENIAAMLDYPDAAEKKADIKNVTIGISGMNRIDNNRFLHELSAFTVFNKEYSHKESEAASNRKAIWNQLINKTSSGFSDNSIFMYLPKVLKEDTDFERKFDSIVTIYYPGNTFGEILETIRRYPNLYVFITEDEMNIWNSYKGTPSQPNNQKPTIGDIRASHSIPLNILLDQEKMENAGILSCQLDDSVVELVKMIL